MTDEETIALLSKVDDMRAELRRLEQTLSRACVEYGRRRGYLAGFREHHVRNSLPARVTA